MTKTILITGATDGIGLETAKLLAGRDTRLLLHGRTDARLSATQQDLLRLHRTARIERFRADLSHAAEVEVLAAEVAQTHAKLDVLINNAGVFKTPEARTKEGLDLRFMVNTIAPYLLTKRLLPLMPPGGRIVNLSSAAQATVDLEALAGRVGLTDHEAYAQSKLALTMWSFHLAQALKNGGPAVIAVNPASLLASKMVKEAFGVAGKDLGVGAKILVRAALDEDFAGASGRYFDIDKGRFSDPHPDALDERKNDRLVAAVDAILTRLIAR